MAGQLGAGALTAHASALPAHVSSSVQDPCAQALECTSGPAAGQPTMLSLPAGTRPCPASGPDAACGGDAGPANPAPGQSSLPAGLAGCQSSADKPMPASAGVCTSTVLDAGAGGAPNLPGGTLGAGASAPASSKAAATPYGVSLSADSTLLSSGAPVQLTATATDSVSGTNLALEIFDSTSQTLIAACGEKTQCTVDYALKGGTHNFVAFVTPPTTEMPGAGAPAMSNSVSVSWLNTSLAASDLVAVPGEHVTLTATSTVDVRPSGRWLEIYDETTHTRVTYCASGTVCSTSMVAAPGSVHELVAHVSGNPESVSAPVDVTWLNVTLSASTLTGATSGSVYLQASVNADLTATPWVLGIYDNQGHLVGHLCRTGSSCTASAWIAAGQSPTYTAVVGTARADQLPQSGRAQAAPASGLGNVVAKSAAVKPGHVLWGVDSCSAFTADPSGAPDLYPQVAAMLGAPDFWGRYLTTTGCPGISAAEIALAASNHMGILPIYDAYDCNAVASYPTGAAYAASAVAAAQSLGIPQGRGLAVDIEPPGPQCPGAGNVDAGFVQGWYDGIRSGGYVPIYYGNGTAGSEFGSAWCAAVASNPSVATSSYLWSFEPDLQSRYTKATAPAFAPYNPGCVATPAASAAWQYQISLGATPDVDHDLALSTLPLWFP